MDQNNLLLALSPLILISVGLQIFALIDLVRRESYRVQGGKKWVWALVIILGNTLGSIVYLVAGRTEGKAS
ncbi:MAG: hypothetical protein JWP00_1054 [Chloroflexi bacterium]|jgi:hypothetical protein|nr:hypothetical protein [Chloroflexota bacterium]